jgi:hypothetical protein
MTSDRQLPRDWDTRSCCSQGMAESRNVTLAVPRWTPDLVLRDGVWETRWPLLDPVSPSGNRR